jgi:XTP/dITP diphosphohydrolase
MRLYVATSNAGKLAEYRRSAGGIEIAALTGIAAPEETGATFEENAAAKAAYYSRYADGPVFADDSGLCVEALEGSPGVHSARFAGDGATDEENNALLLERLRGRVNRAARFVCVIGLAEQGDIKGLFEGEVEGEIAEAARGAGGFGYDPLFVYPPLGRTFGELNREDKWVVSHRGRAFAKLISFLSQVGSTRR